MIDKRKISLFVAIAFAGSWLLVGIFVAFGGKWNTPSSVPVGIAYMFFPLLAAVVVGRFVYGERLKEPLAVSFRLNRWFLVAWLLPPAAALAAFAVALLFPGVHYSPGMAGMFERFESIFPPDQVERIRDQMAGLPVHPFWMGLLQALAAAVTVNAVAAFGEEAGWRGFLHKELIRLGFWKCSYLTGLIWGVWHAPIILMGHNYPQHPVIGVVFMILFCLLYSPLLTFVRIKSGSVIAAAVLHGSINASWGLSVMLLAGGNDLTIGMTGLAGLIVLTVLNAALRLSGAAVSAYSTLAERL